MKKVFFFSYVSLCLLLCNSKSFGQWQLTGNSNAAATSVLGTTNAIPLNLTTNNVQRLVIDANGKIGIGTATPINILTVKGAGSTPAASWVAAGAPLFVGFGETAVGNADYILAMASATNNGRPVFVGRRSRGTLAVPASMANNDFILSMLASAHDGTNFQNPATIDFLVDGTVSAGNVPARISFVTGSNSTNRAERLKVGSTGDITFNTNQLFLQQSTGFLGIGTTSPNAQLQLANTVVNRKLVLADFANNDHQFYGFGVNSNTLRYQVDATTASHVFYAGTGTTTSNELMRIQGSGNVGIGTTAPFANFVVNSGSNGTQQRGIWSVQYSNNGIGALIGGRKSRGTEAAPLVVNNGDYGAALVAQNYDGTTYLNNGGLGYRVTGNPTAGNIPGEWYFGANSGNEVDPYGSNTVRMVVQSSGKVGIGTTAPAAKLDVAGNIKIADGTQGAGKVLTSDATGLASWQAPSGSLGPWTITGNNIYNSNSGNIGIGNATPSQKLDVTGNAQISGNVIADAYQTNNGTAASFGLQLGGTSSGEVIGSKRTATGNQFGLDFFTGSLKRLAISNTGFVGIGVDVPSAHLEVSSVSSTGTSAIIKNTGTGNVGLELRSTATPSTQFIDFMDGATNNTTPDYRNRIASTPGSLAFSTNAVPNTMTILNNGNVGIGTTTPAQKLEVAGTIQANNNVTVDAAQTNNGLVTGNVLRLGGNTSGEAIGSKRTASGNQFGMDFYTASTNRMAITSGGNVGIGTTTPSNKLSVSGDANVDGSILARNAANTLAYGRIQHTGNSGNFHLDTYGTGGVYLNYFSGTGTYICNGANGIVASFLQNGNVGIGITPSTYKLEVCGTIRAKEVRVETGWCDYVFANDYKLRPLADVESFIKENKHLPDVTPGAEIESNGLEVGKSSAQMIRKIEELTLYLIEQQKLLDKVTAKNAGLEARMNSLEKGGK